MTTSRMGPFECRFFCFYLILGVLWKCATIVRREKMGRQLIISDTSLATLQATSTKLHADMKNSSGI